MWISDGFAWFGVMEIFEKCSVIDKGIKLKCCETWDIKYIKSASADSN